jgi:hypothetical protein
MRVLRRVVIGFFIYAAACTVAGFTVRSLVPEFGEEDDDAFSVVASMAGRTFESSAPTLRTGTVMAFMGGVELDLRHASIVDGATLSLRAFMGGIDVLVPAGWRVEVAKSVVMGGITNRTDPDGGDHDAPLLLIDAVIAMGGIEIRSSLEA